MVHTQAPENWINRAVRNIVKRTIIGSARRLVRFIDKFRAPTLVCPQFIRGLERVHGIGANSVLAVHNPECDPTVRLTLGRSVWIGDNVEIEAVAPASVIIGEETSLQHGCVIRGDVSIGANCIFARNVLVISTVHHFRDRPTWLIRDQDQAFFESPVSQRYTPDSAIRIEEDCWFGQGSAVMPGVYIGRGAIVGANSVITRDIPPYEVHGGAPNRKIGQRLSFSPPSQLDPLSDMCLPYFYRGFHVSQTELAVSRRSRMILASHDACLVLAKGSDSALRLEGSHLAGNTDVALQVCINGQDCGAFSLVAGQFDLTVPMPALTRDIPVPLQGHTVVALRTSSQTAGPLYGLSGAKLIAC
jgi:acetyltransferase-like isoleucine patch superfamily enzyme